MKNIRLILKSFFIISLLCLSASAKEFLILTQDGEQFQFNIEKEKTIVELEELVNQLLGSKKVISKIIFTMDNGEENDREFTDLWNLMAKRHGQFLGYPREYFTEILQQEKDYIYYIITFLANRSLISIASNKGSLEDAGDKIDHIHPLKFMKHIFTNEELKVGIRNIRGKGWVWAEFVSGFKECFTTESNLGNIKEDHIFDFAKELELSPHAFSHYLKHQKWDDFIDFLIVNIPRKGDHHRYDS